MSAEVLAGLIGLWVLTLTCAGICGSVEKCYTDKPLNDFMQYCVDGDLDKIQQMIAYDNKKNCRFGLRITHIPFYIYQGMKHAVEYNRLEVFKFLHDYSLKIQPVIKPKDLTKINPEISDENRYNYHIFKYRNMCISCFDEACRQNYIDIVKYMINNCYDMKRLIKDDSCKGIALAFKKGSNDVLEYLFSLPELENQKNIIQYIAN